MAASVWKGHLTFGLVSLPVKLLTAARPETVSFNQLHEKDHSRIKNVIYCQLEDKPIPRDEIVKGYEYEKNKYVVVEDAAIKAAAPPTAKTMEILEFVKAAEVDPVYFESSYYMAPDEAGEKPYALLFEAMRKTGYLGIAKVAMHNREHIVLIRPGAHGIVLHTMYYRDEVRQGEEYRTDTKVIKDKELALAKSLVEGLEAPFEPEKYSDQYRENLRELIAAKVEGREVVEVAAPERLAPVVDIMDALKASLEKMKKPVRSAGEARGSVRAIAAEAERPKKGRKVKTG
jgi:DNA end-binding protein Ku